ncbi:hypothetical protein AB0O91_20585 [Kitasatospora sp. NPDC089797]|uniref:hypothetical protein n=1 Tax=Kitasatospora sp. NPDC089797 TaxID=3155298 RepID=UPI00341FAEC8
MNDSPYAIVPADPPPGFTFQAWVVRDRDSGRLVKALPPSDEPLRFYSFAHAEAWIRRNEPRIEFEVRLIGAQSPHFLHLDSWGLWNLGRHEYLRVPGSSLRIRRFYSRAAAEAFRQDLIDPAR